MVLSSPENLGSHELDFLGKLCEPPWILLISKGLNISLGSHFGGIHRTIGCVLTPTMGRHQWSPNNPYRVIEGGEGNTLNGVSR
jgi:hypothetical protein